MLSLAKKEKKTETLPVYRKPMVYCCVLKAELYPKEWFENCCNLILFYTSVQFCHDLLHRKVQKEQEYNKKRL